MALETHDELAARPAKFIENPKLERLLAVSRSQRCFLIGAGSKPGNFPVTDVQLAFLKVINLAGGLDDRADLLDVRLIRGDVSNVVPRCETLFEGHLPQKPPSTARRC